MLITQCTYYSLIHIYLLLSIIQPPLLSITAFIPLSFNNHPFIYLPHPSTHLHLLLTQLEDNIYIKSRSLKIPTKKMGCPAKIDIKKIAKFPQFEVS